MNGPFEHRDYDDHERIVFVRDAEAGLSAIIALHRLGPRGNAAGGVRMRAYSDSEEALSDVLRLSQAMSYKFALAGLKVGGGKAVILADPKTEKTPALLAAFGHAIDSLAGAYSCGPDVGTTSEDMAHIAVSTEYVRGLPGKSGDTGPGTAWGVFHAIRAALQFTRGSAEVKDVSVAVQGLGGVGWALCEFLHQRGARLIVADIDDERVEAATARFGARRASSDAILAENADVLSPCALGAVFRNDNISDIKAKIICGGANNQLATPDVAEALKRRGILFVPDYVANAGGVINASSEVRGASYDRAAVFGKIERIFQTTLDVLKAAEERDITPDAGAGGLARAIIDRSKAIATERAAAERISAE